MNRYSVLLVDDEEEVIRIMMKKIDWESMGFAVAGYAHNGAEALEMAEELQPDVVVTDIKMPYMDGLTLCRKLRRELCLNVRLIIFSGFDEFEYAKEAIELEVEQYLLKPVDAQELTKVFLRLKASLDRERKEKRDIDKLRTYYEQSLPFLQENFYTQLLDGRISREQVLEYRSEYKIDLEGPYAVVTVLHISAAQGEEHPPISALLFASVQQLAEEQLGATYRSRPLMYGGDLLLISELNRREELPTYTDALERFCRLAKRVLEVRVTAGIGEVCEGVLGLSASYKGAREAVSYRTVYGRAHAISISEIDPGRNTKKSFVAQAIAYVEENYSNRDISVETVCDSLHISAAYFSTVFKKETGKTFIGYLTDYRMERALELLLHTEDKTYIIAEKTGYADPNYFSYVFKKRFGIAPSRYRRSAGMGQA